MPVSPDYEITTENCAIGKTFSPEELDLPDIGESETHKLTCALQSTRGLPLNLTKNVPIFVENEGGACHLRCDNTGCFFNR